MRLEPKAGCEPRHLPQASKYMPKTPNTRLTNELSFPGFHFFLSVLCDGARLNVVLRGGPMSSPPCAGRSSFPGLKGAKKRIGVFKAQQEGDFAHFHAALFQIMMGKIVARLFNELLKGDASVR